MIISGSPDVSQPSTTSSRRLYPASTARTQRTSRYVVNRPGAVFSREQSNSSRTRGPGTKNSTGASVSATMALAAIAQLATTVRTVAPVVPSSTRCSPSPQARRLAAEAQSAPAPRLTMPEARAGS